MLSKNRTHGRPKFEKPYKGSTGFEFTVFGYQFFWVNKEMIERRNEHADNKVRGGAKESDPSIKWLRRKFTISKVG